MSDVPFTGSVGSIPTSGTNESTTYGDQRDELRRVDLSDCPRSVPVRYRNSEARSRASKSPTLVTFERRRTSIRRLVILMGKSTLPST